MFGRKKTKRSPQHERVLATLRSRGEYPDVRSWFEAIALAVGEGALDDQTLTALAMQLHESTGAVAPIADDPGPYRWLWQTLAARNPDNDYLALLANDADYQQGGDKRQALERFLKLAERSPELFFKSSGEFHDLARAAGPSHWLRFRLIQMLAYAGDLKDEDDVESLVELIKEVLGELDDVLST
jgi:hypothetical protein